jgi:hypothetical protein
MKWTMSKGKVSRGPYSICTDTRGDFAIWFRSGEHYGILKRGVKTLEAAKEFTVAHAAKEQFQAKQLVAVFVK